MQFQVDTHTHTVLSGHAHSTLLENAAAAAKNGISGFVITDHGPMIPGASPDFVVNTYPYLPPVIEGVRVYHGMEANVLDGSGKLDIRDRYIGRLDFLIAGFHELLIETMGVEKNTDAMLAALNNPYVDTMSHPDNPRYPVDYQTVIKETVRLGKLVELNNHSIEFRKGGMENVLTMLTLCKKYGASITVASDAHFATQIGQCDVAAKLLKTVDFPQELIINLTKERFDGYLEERKKRITMSGNKNVANA